MGALEEARQIMALFVDKGFDLEALADPDSTELFDDVHAIVDDFGDAQWAEGHEYGEQEGYNSAQGYAQEEYEDDQYDVGYENGRAEGIRIGHAEGHTSGYSAGYDDGYEYALEDGS